MKNTNIRAAGARLLFALLVCSAWPVAQAADVAVNCGARKNNSITAALAGLIRSGPNTIRISGDCNEAVSIDGYDRLTLIGNPTATINDPTPDQGADYEDTTVLNIMDSDRVVVQAIAVNGGAQGISCSGYSVCRLFDVHVRGSLGNGVTYARSSGFIADNTIIEDNAGAGLVVVNGANVNLIPMNTTSVPIIRGNGAGANVTDDSHLQVSGVIRDNTGNGITAERGSNVRILGDPESGWGIVTGNGGHGLFLRASTGVVSFATITGNTGNGVQVAQLSYARFQGANTISGNAAPDIDCSSATAATLAATTSGVSGGGTTDCVEPAP